LRAYLFERPVTRNGHPAAPPHRMSVRQVRNVLSTVCSMLNAAKAVETNLLSADFRNPFTCELIGPRPQRDPLAPPTLPLDVRVQIVAAMDHWQVCALALPLLLPPRPDEFVGLLVDDVLVERRELLFATRWGGDDHNKARQSFRVSYPPEFDPIVADLIAGRTGGPLLRRRTALDGRRPARGFADTPAAVEAAFEAALRRAGHGDVQTEADRKRVFRRVLCRLGGVAEDGLAEEFKRALGAARPDVRARFYDLRGSVLTDMRRGGVEEILRLYLSGRSLARQIVAEYESQDLHDDMRKYFGHAAPLVAAIAERYHATRGRETKE
jgi:hypothetical protein